MTIQGLQRHGLRQRLALAALTWVLAIAWGQLATTPVAAEPVLTLDPNSGPCETQLTMRGAGFPPGQPIRLSAGTVGGHSRGFEFRPMMVGADGAFAREVAMAIVAGPCRPGFGVPAGAQFNFYVETDEGSPGRRGVLLATAVFTVTASPSASPSPTPPMPGLPNTGAGSPAGQHQAWGTGLALLLVALGGAYAVRPGARRRG